MSFESDFDTALANVGFPTHPLEAFLVTPEHRKDFEGDDVEKNWGIKVTALRVARARLGVDANNYEVFYDIVRETITCSAGFDDTKLSLTKIDTP